MNQVAQDIEIHIPALKRYAYVLARNQTAAEDLVQECAVRALTKAHFYKPDTNLRAWLFTILHNLHISEIRRQGKWKEAADPDMELASLSEPAPQTHAVMLRSLEDAMARLPANQQDSLYLVGVEGQSYREASNEMRIPVGTVKSRCSRARVGLRRALDLDTSHTSEEL